MLSSQYGLSLFPSFAYVQCASLMVTACSTLFCTTRGCLGCSMQEEFQVSLVEHGKLVQVLWKRISAPRLALDHRTSHFLYGEDQVSWNHYIENSDIHLPPPDRPLLIAQGQKNEIDGVPASRNTARKHNDTPFASCVVSALLVDVARTSYQIHDDVLRRL